MAYVQKRGGVIVGVYRKPQQQEDGTFLTEPDELPDDHPEVVAYLAPKPEPPPVARIDPVVKRQMLVQENRLRALEGGKPPLTPPEFDAELGKP